MGTYVNAKIGTERFILYPVEQIPVRLDVQTIDNGQLGNVLGDISQPIQFAGTEYNNRFFQNAFDFGFQDIPGTNSTIEISLENDEQTLMLGHMQLNSWDKDTGIFECSLMSDIVPLIDSLDGKSLNDTIWGDLGTVTLNMSTILGNQNDATSDVSFPLVDFGHWKDGRKEIPDSKIQLTADVTTQGINTVEVTPLSSIAGDQVLGGSQYWTNNEAQTVTTTNIISPTPFHGNIAVGENRQGNISSYSTPLRAEQFQPAIRLKAVVDAIFKQVGADYDALDDDGNNFFSTKLSDVWALPKTFDGLGSGQEPDFSEAVDVTFTDTPIFDLNPYQTSKRSVYNEVLIVPGSPAVGGGRNDPDYGVAVGSIAGTGGANFTNGRYKVPAGMSGSWEFTFDFEIDLQAINFTRGAQYLGLAVVWFINEREVSLTDLDRITEDTSTTNNITHTATYKTVLNEGDTIHVAVSEAVNKGAHDVRGSFVNMSFRTTEIPQVLSDTNIDFGRIWGDTSSLDMLNAIVQQFNLVITADKHKRDLYHIQQYYDWILSGNRVDWSDKVQSKSYSSLLPEQSKKIVFAGAEGDDILNAQYIDEGNEYPFGYDVFESSDEGITNGEDEIGGFFTSIIDSAPTVIGRTDSYQSSAPGHGIPHIYELEDDGRKNSISGGILLGYHSNVTLNDRIYVEYTDAGTHSVNSPNFRTLSHVSQTGNRTLLWSDLVEGNVTTKTYEGCRNVYWQDYLDHLYTLNNQLVTAEVLLSPDEYQTLNINDIIHIDGVDHLIKRINGFNLSNPDVRTVELITFRNNFEGVFRTPVSKYVDPIDPDLRTMTLGIECIGYDGDVSEGVLFDIPVIEQSRFTYSYTGESSATAELGVSDTEEFTFKVTAAEGYAVSASNFIHNAGTLDGVSVDSIVNDGVGGLDVTVTLTAQSNNVYRHLVIRGEVDELVGDNNEVRIDYSLSSGSSTNVSLAFTERDYLVPAGSIVPIELLIEPNTGFSITSGGLSAPTISNTDAVQHGGFTTLGVALLWRGTITVPQNDETDVNIEFNIPAANVVTIGEAGTSMVEILFDEAPLGSAGISNVSLNRTSLAATGIIGTTSTYNLICRPASGYELDSDNFSLTENAAFLVMDDSLQIGDSVLIPIEVTFPVSDASTTVVVNGIATLIGEATLDHVITFTNNLSANTTLTESVETLSLPEGGTVTYSNTLTANAGYNLAASDITITNATGWTVTPAGRDAVNITKSITIGAANSAENPVIDGTLSREPYTLFISVTNNVTDSALSRSVIPIGFDAGEVGVALSTATSSESERSFTIQSNNSMSAFTAPNDVTISGVIPAKANTISSGVITIVLGGTIPAPDADGNAFLDVEVNANDGRPPRLAATTGNFATDGVERGLSGGSGSIGVTTNGRWTAIATGGGVRIGTVNNGDQLSGSVSYFIDIVSTATTGTITLHPFGDTSTTLDTYTITRAAEEAPVIMTSAWRLQNNDSVSRQVRYIDGQYNIRFITLTASGTSGATQDICAADGSTNPQPVTEGASVTVTQGTFISCGIGTITDGDGSYADEAGDSINWNGYSLVVDPGGTAGANPNTIYFT